MAGEAPATREALDEAEAGGLLLVELDADAEGRDDGLGEPLRFTDADEEEAGGLDADRDVEADTVVGLEETPAEPVPPEALCF